MKKVFRSTAILILFPFIIGACKKDAESTGTPPSSAAISGKITDAAGHSLQNAKVTLEHTVWYDDYVFAVTDNNGQYTAQLPDKPEGTWTAKAQLERTAFMDKLINSTWILLRLILLIKANPLFAISPGS